MVAARPVVIVVFVAFLAASTKRLWLGASSLRKKSIGDTGLFAPDRHDGGLSIPKVRNFSDGAERQRLARR